MPSKDNKTGIQPFQQFVDSVHGSEHRDFAGKKGVRVSSPDEFERMKAYLAERYQRVEVLHSFVDENGSVFDCVPIEQQPAFKGLGQKVPEAPHLSDVEEEQGDAEEPKAAHVESLISEARKDKFGNATACPTGTIPLRRITLQELARHESLRHFFQKSPVGASVPPGAEVPSGTAADDHRYAHADQYVDNLGGHGFLNVWNPSVDGDQIFSLSQQWYTAYGGSGIQTAEVGWQVYPAKYSATKPVFFIYWTADAYNTTGCYNLDGPGFVQTNGSWAIGGALSSVSAPNGAQAELEVAFHLVQGRWWLYVKGTRPSNAIGYYPVSIYQNGPMATQATHIDYGGEAVGLASWPPMGSGAFANAGYKKAAYQKGIYYFPPQGGTKFASLYAYQQWPQCYTAKVSNMPAPWNETLYFGGPGGTT